MIGVFICELEVIPIKNKKKIKVETERDRLKMEVARELGLWERVEQEGWNTLTNAECGRVGGIMRKRLQEQNKQDEALE